MIKKDVTLVDLKAKVPPGGLLNPGLRKGFGKLNLCKIKSDTLKIKRKK